jgi:GTP-binding protein
LKKHAIVTERPRAAQADPANDTGPRPLLGAAFEGAATNDAQLPPAGAAEVAFAGRSNAGKSSALNALARHRGLAFASRTPGRTQQVNFFRLRGGGYAVDLPGYGYAAVSKTLKREWQAFLWNYVCTRATLVGLVVVVDARHGLKDLDRELLAAFAASSRPLLVLATKVDKLNRDASRKAVVALRASLHEIHAGIEVVPFSAVTREGVAEADRILAQWLPEEDRKRPRDQGE